MTACSVSNSTYPTLNFEKLNDTPLHFSKVQEVFKQKLEPLYGDQTQALLQIHENKDRTCELLFSDQSLVGLIVYKNVLQNEFAKDGIVNSLEIKTLIVIHPEFNSGKGYGTALHNRIIEVAKKAFAKGVHVTVSEKAKGSLEFFQKKGFKIIHTWNGKYQPNTVEYLLHYEFSEKKTYQF